MSFECFLAIYCVGLVVLPVAFGIWKHDEVKRFETEDYLIAFCLLVFWPAVVLGSVLALVLGIIYYLSYVFRWLIKAGVWFREYLIRRKARSREKAEREHAERVKSTKPGDQEYFDYVCD